jgi:hypothetical protein
LSNLAPAPPLAGGSLRLPFAHLNLRFNPFGEASREERAALAVVDLPVLRPGDVVQFLGHCGHGKTTHLLALAARHPGAVYERLEPGQGRCRGPIPAEGLFLLDEAQRLRHDLLARLLRRRGPLALGSHVDLSPAAGRPLPSVRLSAIELPRLQAIVERRIAWARRGPGPVPVVPERTLRELIARHGAQLRAIEGSLYDAIQAMKEPGHVEV